MPKHQEYSKEYRNQIGFTSQETAKEFLAGKDVEPQIDFVYIELLNERISSVIRNLNDVITDEAKRLDLDTFLEKHLVTPYTKLKNNNIIGRLNNQGRRPEEVLFSWLRGYVASEFFCLAISKIFEIKLESILHIGEDDLNNIEIFKRGPRADLQIQRGSQKIDWKLFVKSEKDKVSIEHIYPQTPSHKSWKENFKDYKKSQQVFFQGTLGNLLPLSQSINSSLQNDCFEDKKNPKYTEKKEKVRQGYSDGSHSEIEVSGYDDWNPDCILERGLSMLEFMEKRWEFKFEDEYAKAELLFLEFMFPDEISE